jgi:FtsP/CotA-like multicopper oxidase with cupredoxin domain
MAAVVSVELEASELEWEFAPGRSVVGFGFNGQVPGPPIGAEVGDTLEVRLTNNLPQATTIHWHGVRVPAEMDGTEAVQAPVEPGGTFDYRFVVPDAGTFWYHSHTNETEQLERGLYGPMIVCGPGEPKFDRERVLVLDDLKLDADGAVAPFGDPDEHHAGREGDIRLVNGRQEPALTMPGDTVERWRIVNAANTRFVRLSISGRPFTVIGTDGGLVRDRLEATEVLITPGERVELEVGPFQEGEELEIEALPYDRGKGESPRERFASLSVGAPELSQVEVPGTPPRIDSLADRNARPSRTISLKALMHEGHHQRAEPVRVGELQVWDLVNETGQDHPFHLHGFFFQVLEEDGRAPAMLAWKDTVNVPRKTTTRIAWLPDDRPGQWMYHCHILEHHAMGMMAHFEVVPSP